MQFATSKNTSINTNKMPAIWRKINYVFMPKDGRIVDYGAGQWKTQNLVTEFLSSVFSAACQGVYYNSYDPYWNTEQENQETLSHLTKKKDCELCICANVLNVIDDDEVVKKIITEVTQAKRWAFQIYEGDKTGISRYSNDESNFQRHAKTINYSRFFAALKVPHLIKGNIITNDLQMFKH